MSADTILIWGAGAIGGTLGAHWVRAGHDVLFVDTAADHVRAMQRQGLAITGPIADFTVRAHARVPEEVRGEFGRVMLCVKAHHTEDAARALAAHLARDGCVVSVQNGLNEKVIAGVVGKERTVGAFVNFGADYIGPGIVHYGGHGAVVVGELDGVIGQRIRDLHALFCEFDTAAILTRNVWGYLWSKLAYGALLFATALTDDSIADCLSLARYRALFIALAKEVLGIALRLGVIPEAFDGFDPTAFAPGAAPGAAAKSLEELAEHNRRSAKTHSGIWRDLAVRKRRTEVDAQLGPVLAGAAEVGTRAPLTERLIALIHEIEDGKRAQRLDALSDLAACMA